jgi:hypothetical protein
VRLPAADRKSLRIGHRSSARFGQSASEERSQIGKSSVAMLKQPQSKGSRPVYNARAKQSPDSGYITTIGAAWEFKEGEGLVVKLHFLPLDGSFISVPPKKGE